MRALLELAGRCGATLLLVRPLVPAVGRLALVGLLLTVGRLVLARLELLPTRADEELPAYCGRDMLPPLVKLLRPLLGKARLIDPPLELPCLTLAT